jgi:hypothetical protein
MKGSDFCDVVSCRPLKSTDVSEEPVASISIVEEKAKQDTRVKASGSEISVLLVSSFHPAKLPHLFFDSENGDEMVARNMHHTALCYRVCNSS